MIDGRDLPNSVAVYASASSITKGLLMSFLIVQLLYQNFENSTRSVQAFESMSCDDSKISVGIFWSTLTAAATHGMTWSFYGIGNSEGYLTPPLGSRVPPELWIE
jgi:hypothetical protein